MTFFIACWSSAPVKKSVFLRVVLKLGAFSYLHVNILASFHSTPLHSSNSPPQKTKESVEKRVDASDLLGEVHEHAVESIVVGVRLSIFGGARAPRVRIQRHNVCSVRIVK